MRREFNKNQKTSVQTPDNEEAFKFSPRKDDDDMKEEEEEVPNTHSTINRNSHSPEDHNCSSKL